MKKLKRIDRHIRRTALLLVLVLTAGQLLPWSASAADGDIIIRSAEDLHALSSRCALDTWSQGKTVILAEDIDLEGDEFVPIPTFGGTFDGGGHTISGLSLSGGTSVQGLFRYIQESGIVQNLRVEGTVSASGAQETLGGIAGSNEGRILDCSFIGSVTGKSQVGGIVGVNEASGSLFRCTSDGAVTGEAGTGGIIGHNSGVVTGCTNRSAVNTRHLETGISLDETLDELNQEDALDTTTDTGGIAGSSGGVLQGCRNEGAIGYPHLGYNVGGIAGRSSGYVDGCVNTGSIQGRKDVGGVIGQMTPNIRLVYRQDHVDSLRSALDRMDTLVDTALDHASDSKDTLHTHLDQLSGYAGTASDSISILSDALGDWADSSIDTFNDIADAVADSLDRLEKLSSGGEDILDTLADGSDYLESGLEQGADAMGLGGEGMEKAARAVKLLRAAVRQTKTSLAEVRQALRDLAGALLGQDQTAAQEALEQLEEGSSQLSDALEQGGQAAHDLAGALAEQSESGSAGENLSQELALLGDGLDAASDATEQVGRELVEEFAPDNSGGPDWDGIRQAAEDLLDALAGFSRVFGTLDRSMKAVQDAFSKFAGMSEGMDGGLRDFAQAMDCFEQAARDTGDVFDDLHDLFADLADREPVQLDKLGDDFHQAEDDLHNAVSGMGDQLDALRASLNSSGDTLSADIRALGDQFQVVANLLLDVIEDARDTNVDNLWDDVSEEAIDSTTLGKARSCSNNGPVQGDLNVGGIAGSMSVESDFDPEEDITQVGKESFDFLYETRAILHACVNRGAVTAKKNAAGGAVGYMPLGYLLRCENYGPVESTSGDYVGGIAGQSDASIRSCWAKCALQGGSYVGGIAGCGKKVAQCVSLVTVEESKGHTGAVVGDWDQEDGSLRENRFVEGPLAGVDGVSYAGRAEPVAYASLLSDPDLPTPFRRFTLTYRTEDAVVDTMIFSYGDSLVSHPISDGRRKCRPSGAGSA